MAVRLNRAEQATATEWRLLEAAYRVFLRLGFHGATLDAVAHEAGFTKGAVYSRFGSKADLFLALLECRARQRAQDIRTVVGAGEAAVAARSGQQWVRIVNDDLAWILLAIEFRVHAARDPELNRRYAELHGLVHDAATDALAQSVGAAGLRPGVSPSDAAHAALALLTGLALERAAAPADVPDTLASVLPDALVRALSADATAPGAGRAPAPRDASTPPPPRRHRRPA